jgi:hypothetical protein
MNAPSSDLAVFVNSTDSFSDCWEPFFKLFKIYWPDCPYSVYLNTERKTFSSEDIQVTSTKIGAEFSGDKHAWSSALIAALEQIPTRYVLYLQEDYFLNDSVRSSIIAEFLNIMKFEDYTHIRVMELGGNAGYEPSGNYPDLWELPQHGGYRISLQAGLWNRERFLTYIKPGESAWELERWGTRRAHKRKDTFFCQNLERFNKPGEWIVPYVPTGIVQGRWYEPAVVDLFARHRIDVAWAKRGFFRPTPFQKWKQRLRSRVRGIFMKF